MGSKLTAPCCATPDCKKLKPILWHINGFQESDYKAKITKYTLFQESGPRRKGLTPLHVFAVLELDNNKFATVELLPVQEGSDTEGAFVMAHDDEEDALDVDGQSAKRPRTKDNGNAQEKGASVLDSVLGKVGLKPRDQGEPPNSLKKDDPIEFTPEMTMNQFLQEVQPIMKESSRSSTILFSPHEKFVKEVGDILQKNGKGKEAGKDGGKGGAAAGGGGGGAAAGGAGAGAGGGGGKAEDKKAGAGGKAGG